MTATLSTQSTAPTFSATTPATDAVALDTATLVPIFRALLADPAVCPVRLERAAEIVGRGDVERLADGIWLVVSSDGVTAYTVDRTGHTCSCPDYAKRQAPCKHALAVRVYQEVERTEAERLDPTPAILVADEPIPYKLTAAAVALLDANPLPAA